MLQLSFRTVLLLASPAISLGSIPKRQDPVLSKHGEQLKPQPNHKTGVLPPPITTIFPPPIPISSPFTPETLTFAPSTAATITSAFSSSSSSSLSSFTFISKLPTLITSTPESPASSSTSLASSSASPASSSSTALAPLSLSLPPSETSRKPNTGGGVSKSAVPSEVGSNDKRNRVIIIGVVVSAVALLSGSIATLLVYRRWRRRIEVENKREVRPFVAAASSVRIDRFDVTNTITEITTETEKNDDAIRRAALLEQMRNIQQELSQLRRTTNRGTTGAGPSLPAYSRDGILSDVYIPPPSYASDSNRRDSLSVSG